MEEFDSLFLFTRLRDHLRHFSASMSAPAGCAGGEEAADECRDDAAALPLKMAAIASILIAGLAGVAVPLVGRRRRLVRADGGIFVSAKAFAAGVILATGFVHMLHGADSAFTDPCLPEWPWRQFPFPGFVAMLAALATLLADILATQFYERKHRRNNTKEAAAAAEVDDVTDGIAVIAVAPEPDDSAAEGKEFGGPHVHGGSDCEEGGGGVASHVRHVVVSQILELGIVSHSVIIGLSLGVSQSPCTIRPLIAALSFHQLFEGFALGGCIVQAQFKNVSAALMAAFFAVTTPAGIAAGTAAASFYNADSPRALVVEGLLDSASAGILIYMALVDLIAADFLKQQKMSSNGHLRAASYLALFLGALAMSSLAIWA